MPHPGKAIARATHDRNQIWFLATLPPPINGQANCNRAMHALLTQVAPLTHLSLGRSAIGKIGRSLANAWTLWRKGRSGDAAYVSIPGQLGAWLLLPAIAAARWRGMAIWFHHHSFRSINLAPWPAMRALVTCAGPQQDHLLLSDGMRERFAALYLRSRSGRAHALSNTLLFPPDLGVARAPRMDRSPTIGHMSVLTPEKGVLYLLDLFDDLRRRVPDMRLVIAGPAHSPAIDQAIRAAQTRHPDAFDYRGEVAGAEKERFYRDIDLFVLPTTLIDEAEPLVMIEAYARGVDVLATPTGCIPDRIRDPALLLTLSRSQDADLIAAQVMAVASAEHNGVRSEECRSHVKRIAANAKAQGKAVFASIRSSMGHDRIAASGHTLAKAEATLQ